MSDPASLWLFAGVVVFGPTIALWRVGSRLEGIHQKLVNLNYNTWQVLEVLRRENHEYNYLCSCRNYVERIDIQLISINKKLGSWQANVAANIHAMSKRDEQEG